ncbi:MAG: hypothetical protein HYW22_00690 [Candidatus Aenigmarchaeota archaeon]|nr:hypothetical protein [Candidatus Aenigmarchaeota archaeon]
MAKPKIPPLYSLVDTLYHTVVDNLSEEIQKREVAAANVFGIVGTYVVTKGLHQFIDEKYLIAGLVGIPIAYAAAQPKRVISIIKNYPVYTSGMVGCVEGGLLSLL